MLRIGTDWILISLCGSALSQKHPLIRYVLHGTYASKAQNSMWCQRLIIYRSPNTTGIKLCKYLNKYLHRRGPMSSARRSGGLPQHTCNKTKAIVSSDFTSQRRSSVSVTQQRSAPSLRHQRGGDTTASYGQFSGWVFSAEAQIWDGRLQRAFIFIISFSVSIVDAIAFIILKFHLTVVSDLRHFSPLAIYQNQYPEHGSSFHNRT